MKTSPTSPSILNAILIKPFEGLGYIVKLSSIEFFSTDNGFSTEINQERYNVCAVSKQPETQRIGRGCPIIREILSFRKSIYSEGYGQNR